VCGFKISHQKSDVLLKHIPGISNSNHKQRKFPVNPRNGQRAGKRLPGFFDKGSVDQDLRRCA
jgi:hypothetical protein